MDADKVLPEDEWYHSEVDLTIVPTSELIEEIDGHMPRDSAFSGNENLCALWDELRVRGGSWT